MLVLNGEISGIVTRKKTIATEVVSDWKKMFSWKVTPGFISPLLKVVWLTYTLGTILPRLYLSQPTALKLSHCSQHFVCAHVLVCYKCYS